MALLMVWLDDDELGFRVLVIFFVFIFLSVCFYISLRRLPIVKHYFRRSPVLPVHQPPPPPKMPPPPSFSQAGGDLHEPGSQFGVHEPDIPHFSEQQSVPRFSEQGAPESLFYTDGRAHDPRYVHEEL